MDGDREVDRGELSAQVRPARDLVERPKVQIRPLRTLSLSGLGEAGAIEGQVTDLVGDRAVWLKPCGCAFLLRGCVLFVALRV